MSRPALFLAALAVACGTTVDKTVVEDTDPVVDTEVGVDTEVVDTEVVDTEVVDTEVVDTEVPVDPCMVEPAVVEIGTGESGFEPLVEGQDLEVVHGGQGGCHHTVAVRVTNAPEFVYLFFTAVDVATSQSVLRSSPVELRPQLVKDTAGPWACSGSLSNVQAVLDHTVFGVLPTDFRSLCGHELELGVRVTTPDGVELGSDTVRIISQPDPIDGGHCAL